jgi:hypothetical protein
LRFASECKAFPRHQPGRLYSRPHALRRYSAQYRAHWRGRYPCARCRQADLLQSVREMKAGTFARSTQDRATEALQARAKMDLPPSQFAKLLGVSARTLQEWEQGRKNPPVQRRRGRYRRNHPPAADARPEHRDGGRNCAWVLYGCAAGAEVTPIPKSAHKARTGKGSGFWLSSRLLKYLTTLGWSPSHHAYPRHTGRRL